MINFKNKARTAMTVGVAVITSALVLAESGSTSSESAYVIPLSPSSTVKSTAIFTTGDSVNNYRMVGIPDGLGAFDNGDGTFTLLSNHELPNNTGITRAHGGKGAFVSKWVINKTTLRVISGSDLMQRVFLWDTANQKSQTSPSPFSFNRFCSADLAAPTAYYNPASGLGTKARIFMNGEEGGTTGYEVAHVVTGPSAGNSYVLGKFNLSTNGSGLVAVAASENTLANPYPQDKTIVVMDSDGGTGIQNNAVAVYVGTKQSSGSEVEKAGLMNGTLKFINVVGNPVEITNNTTRTTNIVSGTRFTLSGTSSTFFSRPEDGAWNPRNLREYYFVTTDQRDDVTDGIGAQIGRTRLWRLTFDDITNPDLGGKIDLLIDGRLVGTTRVNMFDNITVNPKTGQIILLEDVGAAAHNGKVWLYDPATDELTMILKHDPNRFGDILPGGVVVPATPKFNNDEETSGVIDVSAIFGNGYYITTDQAHYLIDSAHPNGYPNPDELVEGGQFMRLYVPFPVVVDKNQCKDSGWEGYFRKDGTNFKNQGDCVSYTNNGK